jgi:hypothetical protein
MAEDPHVVRNGLYTKPYFTVATLPAAGGMQGEKLTVTDANASPWTFHGQIAVGGGTIRSAVMSDGSNWRLHF